MAWGTRDSRKAQGAALSRDLTDGNWRLPAGPPGFGNLRRWGLQEGTENPGRNPMAGNWPLRSRPGDPGPWGCPAVAFPACPAASPGSPLPLPPERSCKQGCAGKPPGRALSRSPAGQVARPAVSQHPMTSCHFRGIPSPAATLDGILPDSQARGEEQQWGGHSTRPCPHKQFPADISVLTLPGQGGPSTSAVPTGPLLTPRAWHSGDVGGGGMKLGA